MRLKSRGLGRKELVMDFREYTTIREGNEVVIVGTIRDPVNWDFTIRVCEDDIVGMSKLILRPAMIGLLLRSIFKRRKGDHWNQDYMKHILEGKERLIDARVKADERILARENKGEERTSTSAGARRSSADVEPTT
jgi:hypothetical protein